jgi:formamidopyrimidine-DNA glycosylase
VSEALFRAGIHPLAPAAELHMSAWDMVADASDGGSESSISASTMSRVDARRGYLLFF